MNPLLKGNLDQVSRCDCGHCVAEHEKFYLQSRCHPNAPLWVFYQRGTGLLSVECAVCRRLIVEVKVSES